MGPVLLLDVRVIVLLVRPAPRELHLLGTAVAIEMLVDELGAIVGVDPEQGKGQSLAQLLQGLPHRLLALAQHRARFGPGGVNVGQVQRVAELTRSGIARVGDQINFGEAGRLDIPAVGPQRNVMFEQGAGLGAPIETTPLGPFVSCQAIIHAARADGEQLPFQFGAEAEASPDPRHPLRQQRFQAHRPRTIGRFPDRLQNREDGRTIVDASPTARAPGPRSGRSSVQQPDGILAMVPAVGTELVQDPPPFRPGRLLIPGMNLSQIVLARAWLHRVTRFHGGLHSKIARRSPQGYILRCAIRAEAIYADSAYNPRVLGGQLWP